jgi:hypothetical protein
MRSTATFDRLRTARAGEFLLCLSASALVAAGLFAICLGLSGHFLPHDEQFFGMNASDLCTLHGCRVVHFMVHDRVSFGGALVAIGVLYLWLAGGPLCTGQAWAWWTLIVSATIGFASFFAYLGYGYLDTWHGIATLGLFPCFVAGLVLSYPAIRRPRQTHCLLRPNSTGHWKSIGGLARISLFGTAVGLVGAGLTIVAIGMSFVLVPQDVDYMGVTADDLAALNPRLIPLIAHDRAGFGGAVCCIGTVVFLTVWYGRPSRGRWWALAIAGVVGFGAAIGIHPAIGYDSATHLAPAIIGAATYFIGLVLTAWPTERRPIRTRPIADETVPQVIGEPN